MKPLILTLALSACAPTLCERVWRDPVTGLYGCERPTLTLALGPRGEGTERRDAPAAERPEPPRDHVTDPEPVDPEPVEPDRATDPDGWQHWRDTTPRRDNGHGNGDQAAPGRSGNRNNAENSEHSGQGNSGRKGDGDADTK